MKTNNRFLFLVSIVVYFLTTQYLIFDVDSLHWFDVAFSLETANIINTHGYTLFELVLINIGIFATFVFFVFVVLNFNDNAVVDLNGDSYDK